MHLVVLDQGIDTSTALGRMSFQILGLITEFEHALMPERTRDGLSLPRPVPGVGPADKSQSSARARSNWPAKCTKKKAPTGGVPIRSNTSP